MTSVLSCPSGYTQALNTQALNAALDQMLNRYLHAYMLIRLVLLLQIILRSFLKKLDVVFIVLCVLRQMFTSFHKM